MCFLAHIRIFGSTTHNTMMNTICNTMTRLAVLACLLFSVCNLSAADRPIIGAIRWDQAYQPNTEYENLFDPPHFHYRVPSYIPILPTSDGKVHAHYYTNNQKTIDTEIKYAKQGGIDYWAFVDYFGHDQPMPDIEKERMHSYETFQWYLRSKYAEDINFCMILFEGWAEKMVRDGMKRKLGGKDYNPDQETLRKDHEWFWKNEWTPYLISLFKKKNYQKVMGNRPLLYVFASYQYPLAWWGTTDKAAEMWRYVREESIKAGTGDPYLVAMTWLSNVEGNTKDGKWLEGPKLITEIGYDALSGYGAPFQKGVDQMQSIEIRLFRKVSS